MKLEKTTESQKTSEKRRYNDACGLAHALDLIGDRWALHVMRELMLGSRRFSELRTDLMGISANVLTQRLEELEQRGLVVRRRLPPPASVQVYELTEWGYEAEPIIQTMGKWAARSPAHDTSLPISGVSILLSFRTMFDPEIMGDFDATIGFRFGPDGYVGRLNAAGFPVARGDPDSADATFTGEPNVLAAAVYGRIPFEQLEEGLQVTGDRAVAEAFCTFFVLPDKAVMPTG
jgi:DNA-binding HxlR family transcriptional regulator